MPTAPVSGSVRGMSNQHATAAGGLAKALDILAIGRIALGIASLAAPATLSRTAGTTHTPELGYMTRIYGARAIALGASYLLADGPERTRLQLLSLGVDVSDTITGASHLVRGDSSRRGMTMLTALTGTYAALGAARALQRAARA